MAKGIKIGATDVKNIYIGSTACKEVFVGTTKVRPTGWQPGANTVAYYSFNGDINDHSGNGWDLTYGPTSYTTLSSGIKTAYFQGLYRGNCPRALLPVVFNKGDLTISMRVNPGSNPARVSYFEAYDSWCFNSINIYNNKLQFEFGNGRNGGQNFDATTTNTQGTWYNIVLTYNSNSNTWAWNKNGTQLNTTSGLTYPTWTRGNLGSIGFTADRSWSSNNKDTLSELIIENKARTAQEVLDYYNQTKGNYGL